MALKAKKVKYFQIAQFSKNLFTLTTSRKGDYTRAVDEKVLEQLEMLYGDKNCFASLHDWFGTAETYWTNLERLLLIAENSKKGNPSKVKEIAAYNKRILDLFYQTKSYAQIWDSSQKQKSKKISTEDYAEATDKSWDELEQWTFSQEKLRNTILDLIDFL